MRTTRPVHDVCVLCGLNRAAALGILADPVVIFTRQDVTSSTAWVEQTRLYKDFLDIGTVPVAELRPWVLRKVHFIVETPSGLHTLQHTPTGHTEAVGRSVGKVVATETTVFGLTHRSSLRELALFILGDERLLSHPLHGEVPSHGVFFDERTRENRYFVRPYPQQEHQFMLLFVMLIPFPRVSHRPFDKRIIIQIGLLSLCRKSRYKPRMHSFLIR
mmetsp:Transcript_50937/g.110699  ORF Transcript_50937/g.110699 Transcript_50937/m.110699 type:complete len:217 (+) Transcript_50937:765-1415(+)